MWIKVGEIHRLELKKEETLNDKQTDWKCRHVKWQTDKYKKREERGGVKSFWKGGVFWKIFTSIVLNLL